MYDVISSPVVTEKSTMGSAYGQVTFRVPLTATKPQVKTAVETLFDVKVKGVNTLILKGKQSASKAESANAAMSKKRS